MKLTSTDLAKLKLISLGHAEVECPCTDCTRLCRTWTVAGLDGYFEACRHHARDVLADAVDFDYRLFRVEDGGLVEVTPEVVVPNAARNDEIGC